ncbi:hypothetical protein [Kitasatospora sp. NPDC097643]|uniref:hypothetical protein n=1 Tax=Kitasatospora sp. NPDC097643 TaxID=3157230 RepID=UPI00331FFBD1
MRRSRLSVVLSAALPVAGTALVGTAVALLTGAVAWAVPPSAVLAGVAHLVAVLVRTFFAASR